MGFYQYFYSNVKSSIKMNLLPSLKDGHLHALSFDMLQVTFFRNFYFRSNVMIDRRCCHLLLFTFSSFDLHARMFQKKEKEKN